ncbi:MAG TPA: hypothetical protein VJ814_00225 [Gaiellaceae bacterium]|nr:hypothetical protein [Gaiellaceae bacterium]
MITLSLVLGGTALAAGTARHSRHSDAKADTKLIKKMAPRLSVKHAKTAGTARTTKNATNAVNAVHAGSADNAAHAATADTATNATTAGNASNLGGQPPSAYMPNGAVQRGTFVLTAGTTGKVLFSDGPLSVTADCAQSGGTATVTVNIVSTVGNWIYFGNTLEPAPGAVANDTEDDSGSQGTFHGSIDRLEAIAPSGAAFHGQDAFGVNWPATGNCYVSAWTVAT